MELPFEDRVWNRACDVDQVGGGIGDRHLWHLLRVDGAVMSGGVGFAADVLPSDDFAAAVEASRYFGLDELAELLQLIAASKPDDDDSHLQTAYDVGERDGVIERAFRRRLRNAPQDFEHL